MERAFGLEIPVALEDLCDPRRAAVVVYDMQAGIVPQIPNGAEVTDRVVKVLAAARDGGYRVFFTRHMGLPHAVAGASQLRTAMAWQRVNRVEKTTPRFLRDSAEFELVPEVRPLPSEAVFDKITMSAFVGTPLDLALRDCGIVAVVLAGIALEVGIEPTARHATDLGYVPILVNDACGWRDAAAAQRARDQLAFAGGSVQTTTDVIVPLLRRSQQG
jgi:nicotinamidase-related amidase